jgi:hypothetical protein
LPREALSVETSLPLIYALSSGRDSLRSNNTSHIPNVKRADQHALANSFRIFEAEFFLAPFQMPALPNS